MTKQTLRARPTLADVAAAAGVSTITVSRMINGTGRVSPATRNRIDAAMEQLGYYRNAAATQLVSGAPNTIGILTSGISEYGYAKTIEGVEQNARADGFAVLISVVDLGVDGDVRRALTPVVSQAPAGVIVVDYDIDSSKAIEALPDYLPVVAASGPARALAGAHPAVYVDDEMGSRIAVDHLLGLGHSTAFIIGPPSYDPDESRSQGAMRALFEAGRPVFPAIPAPDWTPAAGFNSMNTLLDKHGELVTAVVCANDELALGAISAAAQRGLSIPGDISIVGFDNNPISEHTLPSLTTLALDFQGVGSLAFETLRRLLAGEGVDHASGVRPELVVRESTAPPRAGRGLLLPG